MSDMYTTLLLYTRDECELCDKALELFELVCIDQPEISECYEVRKVDISQDNQLEEKFGLCIPVLERTDTNELLYWPFPPSRLREFLALRKPAL